MESERRPDERPTEVVAANEAHERINLLIDRLTAITTERDAWRKQASADGARCQKLHAEVADLREAMKTVPVADFVQRSMETPDSVAALKRDLAQALARAEGAERAVRAARMQRDTYSVRTRELDDIAGDDAKKIDRLTREHDELLEQIGNHVKAYELVQAERDKAREHAALLVDRVDRLKAEYDTERQRNIADRVARSAYETACDERDEARAKVSGFRDGLDRVIAERDEERKHRIVNEQWALREQARAHHYGRLYGRARVAWQLVVDARNGLAALLDGIDAADETFDSDINADQEG
jgi:hypothetical protein